MTIWVLVMYMLNPPARPLFPGEDPHIISKQEFKTRELCERAKEQQERQDKEKGIANDFMYKCVQRKLDASSE